nr:ProQ/FINO family protein [Caballeronia sp. GAWG2-1]
MLARAASLGLSERDARNSVKPWCRGPRTCLIEGAVRVDLNSANAGVVTVTVVEYGNTRLARREQFSKPS